MKSKASKYFITFLNNYMKDNKYQYNHTYEKYGKKYDQKI